MLRGCDSKKMLVGRLSAVDHSRPTCGKGVDCDAGGYPDHLNGLPNWKVLIADHPKLPTLALGYQASDEKPSPSKVLFMTQVHRLRGSLDPFHRRRF